MVGSAKVTAERLRGVLDAVATVSSDLTLEGLLERILRQAGDLVDASSGYLDVLDRRSDRRIGSFAAYGIPGLEENTQPDRLMLVGLLEAAGDDPIKDPK